MVFVVARYGIGSGVPSRLYAFAEDCGHVSHGVCAPSWTFDGRGLGTPVVADGIVYVAADRRILAFDERCARSCAPLWQSSDLGLGTPVVSGTSIYARAAGPTLDVFSTSCGTGTAPAARSVAPTCDPTWTAAIPKGTYGSPVVADGKVVVGNGVGLVVFPASCDSTQCRPLWTASARASGLPLVRDGVVYATDGAHRVYAFPLSCRTDGRACEPAWTGVTRSLVRTFAVGAGGVYMGTGDGTIYAFRTESTVGRTVGGSSRLGLLAALVGIFAAGALLGRRLRT
jgi:outer membrane protein assembly factor BamB